MSGHTPGPWGIDVVEGVIGVMGHGGEDLGVYPWSMADARLIAAAPELLEAAKYVLDNSLLYRVAGWEKLQAAIAKAEGVTK